MCGVEWRMGWSVDRVNFGENREIPVICVVCEFGLDVLCDDGAPFCARRSVHSHFVGKGGMLRILATTSISKQYIYNAPPHTVSPLVHIISHLLVA